ncbi:hypothetical protein BDV33DRAFT_185173, partial [Aspergillus novoparasiticus]
MPCTPCCVKGAPGECEFTDDGRRSYTIQSDLVKKLTAECMQLESRLAELEKLGPTSTEHPKEHC